jgi:hypothetical protein
METSASFEARSAPLPYPTPPASKSKIWVFRSLLASVAGMGLAQMLDAFLEHPFFLNRHRQAPLLKERESFLNPLQQRGTSRKALRKTGAGSGPAVSCRFLWVSPREIGLGSSRSFSESNTLDRPYFASRSGVVRSLANGRAARLPDRSCMSREAHVQF